MTAHSVHSVESVMTTLRSAFQADAALDVQVCFEVHVAGVVVHAHVDHGALTLYPGPTSDADVVIDAAPTQPPFPTTPSPFPTTPSSLVTGPPELLTWFTRIFPHPTHPTPQAA